MDSTRLVCAVIAVLFAVVLYMRRRSRKAE